MTLRFPRTVFAGLFMAAALAVPASAQQASSSASGVGTNYETRLEALEDQMRTLNGSLEQLGFNIRRLEQAMQHMQGDTDARLTKMESAVQSAQAQQQPSVVVNPSAAASAASTSAAADIDEPPPPTAPVKGTLGAIKMQDGKVTGAVNNPQAPPLPDTPADYGLTPQEQFDRAFDLLRQTEYEDAAIAFKAFIDKNPHDKQIDEAKFWYGEALYVQDKFDGAAVAFADAYQQNPNGSKAPDCLLKLALSLEKLGKTADACTTLDSLKGKYPKASVKIRQSADQERTTLKCVAAQAAPAAPGKKQ